MRFKFDENLPSEAAELFRSGGHEAETIPDEEMSGSPDPDVAEVCQKENRVLVTLDLDFADIRTYPPGDYPGLIVLRPKSQAKPRVLNLLGLMLSALSREPLIGCLWIVAESGIRIRESDSNSSRP